MTTFLKILFILAAILLMAAPIMLESLTFYLDKEKRKISYKRFRMLIFSAVYVIAVTVALALLKDALAWLQAQRPVQWLAARVAISSRTTYFTQVIVAVLVNAAIGFLYRLLSKPVRLGLEDKDLVHPAKEDGTFNWRQKAERKVIAFFHTESWFLVGRILRCFTLVLSLVYMLVFVAYLIPAVFPADWIPYDFIALLFGAGYIYPMITLLLLWQMVFFLGGIQRLKQENKALLQQEEETPSKPPVDLEKVDAHIKNVFGDYYVCDVDLGQFLQDNLQPAEHHIYTQQIARAVEGDQRYHQKPKEVYQRCMDVLVQQDKSMIIRTPFFSEFSMYFLRYLSAVVARGDNVVLVCNDDRQIEEVYRYVKEGFAAQTSLFCKDFKSKGVDFDHPIWKIISVKGETDMTKEAAVDDSSILITSLNYLCSSGFEQHHREFIHLIDTVVFVDTPKTVNAFDRQMEMMHTSFRHITRNSARLAQNARINIGHQARYMSKPVRYICFDDTRSAGMDKVLKNLLTEDFISVDAMHYNPAAIVRCYHYEGKPNEQGRHQQKQSVDTDEELGVLMNMAQECLRAGASNVTIFAHDDIPYGNLEESLSANMGSVDVQINGNVLRINRPSYNPDDYNVVIAMDSQNDLPAALRRYVSMVSDKPALVILFSKAYMLRDYYIANLESIWGREQTERMPVAENSEKDFAHHILARANAGGISEEEILAVAQQVPRLDPLVQAKNVNAILREVLEIVGRQQGDRMNLFRYFEYFSTRDFNEKGIYKPANRVQLRRRGTLYDMIAGRNMVTMQTKEEKFVLPLPKSRLTQNYIAGQNMLFDGKIYRILKVDTEMGCIHTRLTTGGKNDECYQYIQDREYRVELNPEQMQLVAAGRYAELDSKEENGVCVRGVRVSAFRAPAEVLTKGYFSIDPHTMWAELGRRPYYSINQPGDDERAKQTYRRYGVMKQPTYSSNTVISSGERNTKAQGAMMMTIRLDGKFGPDASKTLTLAAVMLNEVLRAMFPALRDAVVVCPVLRYPAEDEKTKRVLRTLPQITIDGARRDMVDGQFALVILEDCESELGVVSTLMSAGNSVMQTLFEPVLKYLNWFMAEQPENPYLYFGQTEAPECFDFASLHQLAKQLADDHHELDFEDVEPAVDRVACDFCGKRCARDGEITTLDDGRRICNSCAASIQKYDKKNLKSHLDRAKIFLESTYGISVEEDYDFCFESTVKIVNALQQDRVVSKRGEDVPLKAYVDDRKKVHVEYDIPSPNLSELLVRELAHVWQLKHLPDLDAELAEGHLALVSVQYLHFLNQDPLATVRTAYFESTDSISGEGYRKLVRQLLANPQFGNNPFRYLLDTSGMIQQEQVRPVLRKLEPGDLGQAYTPEQPDRTEDGQMHYFYYDRLPAQLQQAYDRLLETILAHGQQVHLEGCDFQQISTVSRAIRYDRPDLFWYRSCEVSGSDVTPLYGATAEEASALQQKIDQVVPQYLEGIEPGMSAYDVALRIHVRLISAVDYDSIALERQRKENGPTNDKIDYLRSICGVFINGKAVCEGYARAVQYLLQKCGIECAEAVGDIRKDVSDGGSHAWNILKVDGDYYYMDTTWDDSSNTVQTVKNDSVSLDYFCITTEELLRTRDLKDCPTQMPLCTATRANYYHHNGCVLESYDLERIKQMAQTAAKNDATFFTFKCTSRELYELALARLCAQEKECREVVRAAAKVNKKILGNGYSYTYDKNIWTITVYFRYQ